ncbi:hypothetical protein IF1G_08054 [Cordyceps javanica]|uniref:Uncharacterized protein n=1 Tax=Cordyceps javanica TaxID=43265 RepID=A0A545UVK6_9HYPO|nr:hypothetical protein IF1G_08054 [Cordyceps javanica]
MGKADLDGWVCVEIVTIVRIITIGTRPSPDNSMVYAALRCQKAHKARGPRRAYTIVVHPQAGFAAARPFMARGGGRPASSDTAVRERRARACMSLSLLPSVPISLSFTQSLYSSHHWQGHITRQHDGGVTLRLFAACRRRRRPPCSACPARSRRPLSLERLCVPCFSAPQQREGDVSGGPPVGFCC